MCLIKWIIILLRLFYCQGLFVPLFFPPPLREVTKAHNICNDTRHENRVAQLLYVRMALKRDKFFIDEPACEVLRPLGS